MDASLPATESTTEASPPESGTRYFDVASMAFVAVYLISQVSSSKLFAIGGLQLPGAAVVFPLSYIFGDILTEVYGYAETRRVIWTGLILQLFFAALVGVTILLPPAEFWPNQAAFATVLSQVPRIAIASIIAYFAGEFCNSYVLARAKVGTNGKNMWLRFVTSTMAGQAVDTLVFMTIAFVGVFPPSAMITLFISSWVFKVVWEIIALPVSIPLVNRLKAVENLDHYDRETNFSPFRVS